MYEFTLLLPFDRTCYIIEQTQSYQLYSVS